MMVSIQIKKPNGGWGYRAHSRKPICSKMATAFSSPRPRAGGGLGHLLARLFLPLIPPEWRQDGAGSAARRSKAKWWQTSASRYSSQSSLMNAI